MPTPPIDPAAFEDFARAHRAHRASGAFVSFLQKGQAPNLMSPAGFAFAQALYRLWQSTRGDALACPVVLEDFGDWYHTGAWKDEGGYYARLRVIDPAHPTAQGAARAFLMGFAQMFGGRACLHNAEALAEGGTATVWVVTDGSMVAD